MKITRNDLADLDRIYRLNIVNSISGVKPANLVGTVSTDGVPNLAVFSSVVHLGSDPALLGMIVRPAGETPRNTYENIITTGHYTINHVRPSMAERAHYTSAKFPPGVSEFERCGLDEEWIDDFPAPFVRESTVKIGMKFEQEIPIEFNNTILLIGSVRLIVAPDETDAGGGHLNLQKLDSVGISGLNSYYKLEKIGQFPYARPDEVPAFDE